MRWQPGLMSAARAIAMGLCAGVALWAGSAQAALFADDDARKAILELRARLAQTEARAEAQAAEVESLRKALLDLNGHIEQLRAELARSNGAKEQLARDLSELQRLQRDLVAGVGGVDERIKRLEPIKAAVGGREFQAEQAEKRQFDEALTRLRGGDFDGAASAFGQFVRRYPASGYTESAHFWWGNALYGKRDCKEAINAFRVTTRQADHPRAAEAQLAIGNCQIEMKEPKVARATFQELIKAYPDSDAAKAARERLSTLR